MKFNSVVEHKWFKSSLEGHQPGQWGWVQGQLVEPPAWLEGMDTLPTREFTVINLASAVETSIPNQLKELRMGSNLALGVGPNSRS